MKVQIRNMARPYIISFEATMIYVCGIDVLENYRLRHSSEGNVADALLISSGVISSLYNVATLTYFSWSRTRAVERDDCDASESRSKSSSACVAPIISGAVLGGENGDLNLRNFAEGGESNERELRALFFFSISCCFLCSSVISANWRLNSVIFENVAADDLD
jgi:hypothetical protein